MAYPVSVDTFTTKADSVDDVLAAHMNAVQAAIVAVETELGTGLKGAAADLVARLAVALNTDGTLKTAQVAAGIAALSITLGQLAANSVNSAKIVDASITGGDIALTTITGANLQNATISATQIANLAIITALLADGAVTGLKASTALATKGLSVEVPNIPTTGALVLPVLVPITGTLIGAKWGSETALAADNTNYITWAIRNYATGAGTNALLAATDANTTKLTGGAANVARTPRALTLHGTPANLAVTQGDYLLLTVTVTGTLGATQDSNVLQLLFSHVN